MEIPNERRGVLQIADWLPRVQIVSHPSDQILLAAIHSNLIGHYLGNLEKKTIFSIPVNFQITGYSCSLGCCLTRRFVDSWMLPDQ